MISTIEPLAVDICPEIGSPKGLPFLWPVALVIFVLEVLLSGRFLMGFPGPVRYYAEQWTVNYADGFSRRGLLGECLHVLHANHGNYQLIALLGWMITFSLFIIIARYLAQTLSPLDDATKLVLFTAILLSPLTSGILVATTGDPIQLVLILYIVLRSVFLRPGRGITPAVLAFIALGILSTLIHEASMFFIGPFLLLAAFVWNRSKLDKGALIGFVAGAFPTLLVIVMATQHHVLHASTAVNFGRSSSVPYHPNSFSNLLKIETAKHFHSGIRGYVLTIRDMVGTIALPAFFLFILHRVLPARRWIVAFFLPLLLSLPLWAIAHDWGRFSSYLFILAIVSLAPVVNEPSRPLPLNASIVLLLISGITASRTMLWYPQKGLGSDNLTMAAVLLLCAVAVVVIRKYPTCSVLPSLPALPPNP